MWDPPAEPPLPRMDESSKEALAGGGGGGGSSPSRVGGGGAGQPRSAVQGLRQHLDADLGFGHFLRTPAQQHPLITVATDGDLGDWHSPRAQLSLPFVTGSRCEKTRPEERHGRHTGGTHSHVHIPMPMPQGCVVMGGGGSNHPLPSTPINCRCNRQYPLRRDLQSQPLSQRIQGWACFPCSTGLRVLITAGHS